MELDIKSEELNLKNPVPVKEISSEEAKPFGNGAHITVSKKHMENDILVLVLDKEDQK